MELVLESVLEQRSRLLESRLKPKRNLLISVLLHLFLVVAFLLIPILMREEPKPIEFTPITIVPVQALGVEDPVAAPPRQEAPPKSEPKPTPPPKEAEPEEKRAAMPAPEANKKPSQPAAEPSRSTESSPSAAAGAQDTLGQRRGSAQGSSLGTAAFGATVGGLDNPDFVYGYYVDQMLAMIGVHWARPPLGADIEAVIFFRIHKDGHISDIRVQQSSGYNSYDLAGLRAVQTAAPFPKLPQSYRHSSLGVKLVLR